MRSALRYNRAMNLVFDIASSAVFWRQNYPVNRAPQTALPVSPPISAQRKRDAIALLPDWVDDDFLAPSDGLFHALAIGAASTKRVSNLRIHKWNGPVPEGSFYEIRPGVYIESPAFMFLHAATLLEFSQLIAFGDELCGLYSFDEREERGFRKRHEPLSTKTRLASFLQQAAGCRGHKLALKALPYVIERSASPMETFDELTMCLPVQYGGYALLKPQMNEQVNLEGRAARIAGRKKCYLDMGYSEYRLDIEHHGKLDHLSDRDKELDFARVSGLKEMGFEVIELTYNQVEDLITYEYIIQRAARILGKRIRKEALGATPDRRILRQQLFAWNRSSGKLR